MVGTGPSNPAAVHLTMVIAAIAALVMVSGLVRHLVRRAPERVLVLGSSRMALVVMNEIEAHPELSWRVTWFPERPGLSPAEEARRLGRAVRLLHADRIVVGLTHKRGRLPARELLAERVRGARVQLASSTYEEVTGKIPIEALSVNDLVFVGGFRNSRFERISARVVSVGVAVVGLGLFAVLLPFLALAIKLDSDGPVFFRQPRAGLGDKPFDLIKLRTMRIVAKRQSEWERDNRARVTRVGAWLRRLHLDELPQFWNVLRGDMNLVGPRPHPVTNGSLFHERIPFYSLRSLVRPGITGWAQTRYGYANDLDEEIEKMRYDLYYLKHHSTWLDLKMIPDTVRSTLGSGRVARATPPIEQPSVAPPAEVPVLVAENAPGRKS